MFETLFQFLFEYRPHVFQQGDFRFAPPAGAPVAAAVIVTGLAIAFLSYRLLRSRVQWRERLVLGVLRVAALAIILFCIFRPVLVVKAAVAQQNVVGILIDDSRSMQLPATESATGGTRGELVRTTFANRESAVMKALSDRFLTRTFRFSSSTARVSVPGDLTLPSFVVRSTYAIADALGREILSGGISVPLTNDGFNIPFSDGQVLKLIANRAFRVTMAINAEVAANSLPASATAIIDPVFSFAPGVDQEFSFQFSEGIGNSRANPVPEPGPLGLLSAGVVAIGLWRGRSVVG